jgi:hypothetical protein
LFLVFLKCQWDLFDIAPYGTLGPHKGLVFKPSGGANEIIANLLPMNWTWGCQWLVRLSLLLCFKKKQNCFQLVWGWVSTFKDTSCSDID